MSGGRRELGITLRVAMRMRAKVKFLLPNIWTPRGRRVWMSTVLNSVWRQSRGNMSATVCLQHCARRRGAICDSSAHSYVHCTYTADATEVGHLHPSDGHLPRPVENHHRVHLFS